MEAEDEKSGRGWTFGSVIPGRLLLAVDGLPSEAPEPWIGRSSCASMSNFETILGLWSVSSPIQPRFPAVGRSLIDDAVSCCIRMSKLKRSQRIGIISDTQTNIKGEKQRIER